MIAEIEALRERVQEAMLREFAGVWEELMAAKEAAEIEQRVHVWSRRVGRQLLEAGLQAAIERRERVDEKCCGKRLERHARERREVLTLLGPVRVWRRYLRCEQCRCHRRPADEWLGWRGGFSGGVEEVVAWECAGLPYREALASLEKLAGLELSVHAAEGIVARWGATPLALAPQTEPLVGDVVVEIDGASAFIGERWREVKLGTFFGWDRTLAPEQQAPQARSYVASWEPVRQFKETLWQEALVRGTATARSVAVLGDGAPWIWELAQWLFPRAVQILDWYHLSEHLWEAAEAVHGEGTAPTERLVERWKCDLWEGRSEGVEEHLRELMRQGRDDAKETLRKCADYLRTHQHRIRYPLFRAMGWPVGSGVVESGCKQVVGLRLKRKSARWSEPGAEAVLHLRVDRLSNRWAQRCEQVRLAA
jgi:hypothetical protein